MIKISDIFLIEGNVREIPWTWDKSTWWQDNLTFFHGTQVEKLKSIEKEGLKAGPGSKGHGVYLALDPFTARGYASMRGGESRYKKQKARAKDVPMEDRAVLIIEIPRDKIDSLVLSKKDSRLLDKDAWENGGANNPRYWELAEVLYKMDIPPDYIKGYMIKV